MSKTKTRNRKVVVVLLVVVVGMFGFGFVLIPIYRMMANIYGFGGEMHAADSSRARDEVRFKKILKKGVDKTRSVTLQFIVTDTSALNVEFRPLSSRIKLNPGEVKEVSFYVKNLSDRKMVLQAVPTVSPDTASKFLARSECRCFGGQVLKPGQSKVMPVKVIIDRDLPGRMEVMTLSYRLIVKRQRADVSSIGNGLSVRHRPG